MAELMIYDMGRDEHRPATQADIDELQNYVYSFAKPPERDKEPATTSFNFKLAAYVNKMRSDCLFVAEDKEIEPYEGIRTVDGQLCYPSVPRTKYCVPMGMDPDFAREIVKRWNEAMEDWEDKEDQWSEQIASAHPTITKDFGTYETAMKMVGNRHSKHALIELVNWLLSIP